MTAKLDPRSARRHLQAFQFADLFVEDLGWSYPDARRPLPVEYEGAVWNAAEISQLSGFRVFEVTAANADTPFPDAKTQQALWKRIAAHAVENLVIFVDSGRTRSVWLWVKREAGKTRPRRHHYLKGQPGDLFLSKLASLVVDLSELDDDGNLPITETANRVRAGLDIETVTKAFFKDFQDEHGKLLDAIEGIPDPGERRWYVSILLNRLMFIWFLQKKGFLDVGSATDGNKDYLPDKLAASKKEGKNRFFSHFLRDLFFEGFAKTEEKRELAGIVPLGDIPYLNGGLFLPHGIEARIEGEGLFAKPYATIRIPDSAFTDLFALFSRYSWSLDDTPGGDDREINPDVLGYIFEKYINQKEFGAYYTRPEITDYLCEQTIHQLVLDRINEGYGAAEKLHKAQPKAFPAPRRFETIEDLLLHATGPVCQRVIQDILPRLALLDPACGSGAFLVAALKTLLNLYTGLLGRCEALAHNPVIQWIDTEKKQHKAPVAYWLKKKIVTENLYGVDLMEEATEIAKLRLFLSLVASAEKRSELEPLPNIEFNLLSGNSLIGLLHVDASKFDSKFDTKSAPGKKGVQQARITLAYDEALGFQTETITAPTTREKQQAHVARKQVAKYDELLRKKNDRIRRYKESTSLFKDLAALKRDIDALKIEARDILDQLLLDQFQALGIKFEQATWDPKKKKEGNKEKRTLRLDDIRALEPFHWAYEFDEIIVHRGGFDAIITNPPWETFQPNAKEFFGQFDKRVSKKLPLKEFKEIKAELLRNPEIEKRWLDYFSAFGHQRNYFRIAENFSNQVPIIDGKRHGKDVNLFKLFTEQALHLLSKNGRCGIVIPSGIYTDMGSKKLRQALLTDTEITGLFGFENRRQIFENVHRQFKFAVLTFINGRTTKRFPARFMRHHVSELATFPTEDAIIINKDLIEKTSPTSLSIPEFREPSDAIVSEKIYRLPLLLEEIDSLWSLKIRRELNMTDDEPLFREADSGGFPVFEGKMIWQFDSNYAPPTHFIPEEKGRKKLLGKRADDTGQAIGYQQFKLAYRDVASNTNERTLIASILPRNVFTVNTLVVSSAPDDLRLLLYVISAFNSFVVDYTIRQKVTNHCNMFFVYQLPIPRLTAAHPDFLPLVERAARLVGKTVEFDELLGEVFGGKATHKTHGVTDPQDRLTLRAEIDSLVARLYDLTTEEFQHILGSFPLVDQAVKSQTLSAFKNLMKLGEFPRSTLGPKLSS